MYASVSRMQMVDDNLLSCMDYLRAALDYQEFLYLMLDFKVARNF